MINKAILVGRLGREPEYRASQSGKASCRFSLATVGQKGQKGQNRVGKMILADPVLPLQYFIMQHIGNIGKEIRNVLRGDPLRRYL